MASFYDPRSNDVRFADEPSLDALLAKSIPNPNTLRLVREKIADSQRALELKIDSLNSQNHILQQVRSLHTRELHRRVSDERLIQEIACLRNKRSADASPLPSQTTSLKLKC